ncbi:MAG: phosphate propanoyltransferase [Erysipelotrichaceae bacterium]|nr:phosphate propanoyltransferase [Erysipelotrichaceae bacterium]
MEKFLVEISARHLHLTDEAVEVLFGAGHTLTCKKMLSQPGQFACEEKVTVVGPRGELKMSVLGPTRKGNQIEVSFTDARALGLVPPVRESGDTAGSCPCKLVGPCGELELEEGVIVAKRHIHMTKADAEKYGVENGQIVAVKVETEGRTVVFGDTVVRVSDSYALAMHIDTDEGNAAGIKGSAEGEIVTL